ncbi:unnamed protein product [Prorocentrum cordatum]|uniref:Uncharacterized protein n=1 Tax=Prorocentrum cordatum TaxID=2364126 RepID=A0ABN9P7A3_9DINO|nr:unnamed protein product [Polarella glacialis]
MLADALAVVVEKIDALRSTLYEEQHAEVGHRDACVEQGNQVEQELEERTTAEQGYNSTIDRTAAMLNATAEEVSEIEGQIREMDASLVAARTGRAAEHASLKASVQEQLELQRKLRRAIQALKNFYAEKARSPGLLQAAVSASGRLPEDYAFSKGPNLEDGLAGLCFGNSTSSLQRAQLSCSREPDCFFIYDEGCDGTSWRYCAALPGNLSGSSSSGGACTMLKVEKAAPVSTTFSKPLQSHRGAQGILAMLQILLDESEQMIESITQAESQALDTYGQDVVTTQASVQEKTQQVTALNQAYSDAQVELEEAVQARAAVSREREEIVAYRAVVEEKCGPLLEHFAGSQEARAEELERLLQARQTLQGMRESAGAVGLLARRAAVAVRARAS